MTNKYQVKYMSYILDDMIWISPKQSYMCMHVLILTFRDFISHGWHTTKVVPASVSMVMYFVADLFKKGRAPASISSHLSAISYVHKLHQRAMLPIR